MHRERRGSREAPARAPASASRQANDPTPGSLACLVRHPPEKGQNCLGGRASGRAAIILARQEPVTRQSLALPNSSPHFSGAVLMILTAPIPIARGSPHGLVEFVGQVCRRAWVVQWLAHPQARPPKGHQGISEPQGEIEAIDYDAVLLTKVECRYVVRVIEADFGTDHEHIVELVAQGNCVA